MTTNATAARPKIHFTAREGWINDPLGLTFHNGVYHLFFQHVPGQAEWGPHQSWGHATSTDLLHWTEQPVILSPGDGDDGVWSGSLVVPPEGEPTIFYTSVHVADVQIGTVRTAHPADPQWRTWAKGPEVARLPENVDAIAYRDPQVFHDGDTWVMLMGAGLRDGTAVALAHRSDDLRTWGPAEPIASRHRDVMEPVWLGAVWECPQLLRVDGRWVLTMSVWEPEVPYYEAYLIGDLDDGHFVTSHVGRLSYGPSYYAGSAYADAAGDSGLIYWLRGVDDPGGAWASAHSLPHTLHLEGDRLIAAPHAAVEQARVSSAQQAMESTVTTTPTCDVLLTTASPSARGTVIVDGGRAQILVAAGQVEVTTGAGSWSMPAGGTELRLVLDGPVLEVFGPHGTLAVPLPVPAEHVTVEVTGALAAQVWELD
ncbi:glycoside hydrolase family 32 protein [Ruania alkalisoli]|uniref:beta-fructofuranosidase n=1 Tax=Ruania alkalisoli TaxID=2779775 RepID=A0A7M1SUH8_9MICO|nr:glycoside hydrolase family 32 protein [Ruania alkalisoli]QOR70584.1 glycoside hydrolase family 32 protein [Ruania alkalisoli]